MTRVSGRRPKRKMIQKHIYIYIYKYNSIYYGSINFYKYNIKN